MTICRRHLNVLLATVIALGAIGAAAATRSLPFGAGAGSAEAASPSLGTLNSQLNGEQARQHRLAESIAGLNGLIASLTGQIALVQSREADVRAELARDQARLAAATVARDREQARVAVLHARLAHARMILSHQLVSAYESDRPDLVSVVVEAHGFNQLLEQLSFLRRAEQQQQALIAVTRAAKAQADAAEARLARLAAADRRITEATAVQARALAGMDALLHSRQGALGHARAAQQAALAASRDRGARLRAAIARIEAQQAAARAAAAAATSASYGGPALGPSGGWSIPYPIVLCESGGQNLPPNSAGASGYYQIIPGTWRLFGGSGAAAYLTPKSEQDAVASRIWNGGRGASNWVCAGIVGIH
jgi:septal ring factor EnvC (AmiA/AmiB activator)